MTGSLVEQGVAEYGGVADSGIVSEYLNTHLPSVLSAEKVSTHL